MQLGCLTLFLIWKSDLSIVSNNVHFIFITDKYDKLIDNAFGEFINLKVVSATF